jgi:hypothetical protein
MTNAALVVLLATVLSLPVGCSSSEGEADTVDATTLCNELASAVCSKFFSCYSAEELATMAAVAGKDEADCRDKWMTDLHCATDPQSCKAGQTYSSAKANECVSGYKAFTCDQFVGFLAGSTPAPAACSEGCS